ncbi:MAG: ABC transporter permease [Lachnospiraceae bacterium]|nr:ABC transporter permease [Lachnospiraceae bacterium]
MMAAFTYFKMEMKRACRIFPVFMAGAIVLAALLGTIALLAGKVLYGEQAAGRVQTGVILPEKDGAARQAVAMLGSMDSVKSICDFQYVGEEEGRRMLREGELSALLIVPEDFIQSIMDGSNHPVTVILPENPGIEAGIFRELTEAGTRTLKSAQAAIYAADAWCIQSGNRDQIPKAEADLNRIYLKYALDREAYFKTRMVSVSGNMTAAEHFFVCFLVLFLVLGGIPVSGFFRKKPRVFYKKLKLIGIGEGCSSAAAILAVSCMYTGVLAVLGGMGALLWPSVKTAVMEISVPGLAGIFLTAMAAAAMITAVYELCGSRLAGMMVIFWGSIVMMFCSGGILPSAFLPEAIKKIGAVLPGAYMIDALEKALFSRWSLAETGRMAGIAVFFWGAAALGRRSHG